MASCDPTEKSASMSDLADVKHGSALVADKHELRPASGKLVKGGYYHSV